MEAEKNLIEAIRNALMQGTPVHLDGIGTLRPVHNEAREVRSVEGEIRLLPPSVTIRFEAES
jgi:nucleoid DNA-binding protein